MILLSLVSSLLAVSAVFSFLVVTAKTLLAEVSFVVVNMQRNILFTYEVGIFLVRSNSEVGGFRMQHVEIEVLKWTLIPSFCMDSSPATRKTICPCCVNLLSVGLGYSYKF